MFGPLSVTRGNIRDGCIIEKPGSQRAKRQQNTCRVVLVQLLAQASRGTEFIVMFRIRAYLTNISLGCFDLALTTVCYIVVATPALRFTGQEAGLHRLFTRDEIVSIALVLLVWLAVWTYFGMYRPRRMDSPFADSVILFKVGFASWIVLEGSAHVVPLLAPTPSFLVRFSIITFLTLAAQRSALRLIIRELRRRGLDVKQIALIASPDLAERLVEKIERRANYG